jgi:hypothetical protein
MLFSVPYVVDVASLSLSHDDVAEYPYCYGGVLKYCNYKEYSTYY